MRAMRYCECRTESGTTGRRGRDFSERWRFFAQNPIEERNLVLAIIQSKLFIRAFGNTLSAVILFDFPYFFYYFIKQLTSVF